MPGVAWGVNVTAGGEIAVAAYGDGTVRWHRMQDGAELLALFIHVPDKRWVAWTPKGYYAASPGGEDLIGWHVNRGLDDAPDFFPASRFRERFYRPDIVQAVLQTRDEEAAVRQAERGRPAQARGPEPPAGAAAGGRNPEPRDGAAVAASPVKVRYRVRSPSGLPVERIEVLVDGRPPASRGLAPVEDAARQASAASRCRCRSAMPRSP